VVWRVGEIEFFFCLLGVWEIVIFCLQSSEWMFANLFVGPFFSRSSPKGGQRVLDAETVRLAGPAR